ncbi:hypothetical protein FN846DRAFT_912478 [Sphaerosporella brunnea]|uniref:Uncharacterized protein n=1 Tax=Sphaerosporella brunnea TaxID=1250544 RepID=A0A5J5EJB8_9PEZI|nr:hypothetical protein FN846DRAFT_912476 [Sphaerosporella brunnea]KAA8894809.1 hypothetical protein FN846DRAFT_912478 [Sphaerosporella brunnea]
MAQPNWVAVAQAFQQIANQVALVPIKVGEPAGQHLQQQMMPQMGHMVGLLQSMMGLLQEQQQRMKQQMTQMQQLMLRMQQHMQQQVNQIAQGVVTLTNNQALLQMRLHNAACSVNAPLQYPAGVMVAMPQPHTRLDLIHLTANNCQVVAAVLALPDLPHNTPVLQRRKQIADFLGAPFN